MSPKIIRTEPTESFLKLLPLHPSSKLMMVMISSQTAPLDIKLFPFQRNFCPALCLEWLHRPGIRLRLWISFSQDGPWGPGLRTTSTY